MNKQRFAMLGAAIVGALCTFMPWIQVSNIRTIYGFDAVGWYTFSLFLVPIVLLLLNDRAKPVKNGLLFITIIPPIIAGIIGVNKILQFNNLRSGMTENFFTQRIGDSIAIGFGLYLVVIAAFVFPLFALLIKEETGTYK